MLFGALHEARIYFEYGLDVFLNPHGFYLILTPEPLLLYPSSFLSLSPEVCLEYRLGSHSLWNTARASHGGAVQENPPKACLRCTPKTSDGHFQRSVLSTLENFLHTLVILIRLPFSINLFRMTPETHCGYYTEVHWGACAAGKYVADILKTYRQFPEIIKDILPTESP